MLPAAPDRLLSGTERAWITADQLCPPFVNQQVIEGRGTLDPAFLQAAVAQAAEAHPNSRVRLRGWLGWSRWRPGPHPPPVTVVDGASWDGMSDAGAPFLQRPLDPWRGPVSEIVLVTAGLGTRLVVRTHHAAFDGRGAGLFSADLFRALRGEALLGAAAGPLTDAALAGPGAAAAPPREEWPSPLGASSSLAFSVCWQRRRVVGPTRQLLARAISALWHASRVHCDRPLRVAVPVDLRRAQPGLRASGNLTGIAHQIVDGPVSAEALRSHLAGDDAASTVRAAGALRWVPLWLMRREGARSARRALQGGRFGTSVTVSNLGRQDLAAYVGGGFEADASFWIPPGQPGLPLFVTLSGGPQGIELLGSAPVGLASGERLGNLLDTVAERLSQAG